MSKSTICDLRWGLQKLETAFLAIFRAKSKSLKSSSGWISRFIITGCNFVYKYACDLLTIKGFFSSDVPHGERVRAKVQCWNKAPTFSVAFTEREGVLAAPYSLIPWKSWDTDDSSSPQLLQFWNMEQITWTPSNTHICTRTNFHPGDSPDPFRNGRVNQKVSSKDSVLCSASGTQTHILMVLSFHDQTQEQGAEDLKSHK